MSPQWTRGNYQHPNSQSFVLRQQKDEQYGVQGQQHETVIQLSHTDLVQVTFLYEMDATDDKKEDRKDDENHLEGWDGIKAIGESDAVRYDEFCEAGYE